MNASFRRPRWVRQAMAAGGEFHSMKKDPWRHNAINLTATLLLLTLFVGTALLGAVLPAWAYLPLATLLFGCIYFGVNVLIIHECSHNMYVLSRDRKRQKALNRLCGQIASVPFATAYVIHWEKGHTTHHLRPCDDGDPQHSPTPNWRRDLLIALIPTTAGRFNPSSQYPGQGRRIAMAFGLVWGPLALLTGPTLGWIVPLAMIWGIQVTMVLNWIKKVQEHGSGLDSEPDYTLRSRTYLYPLAALFSPFNINYHFEHHANFNVPWYDLPAYHKKLRGIMPEALQPYYFHHDYFAQLREVKPLPPRELLSGEAPSASA